uniref:Fibrinogen C-terminal domain-containing protein n=1 Tax=Macrostomum lignano TaxID=282301 RepID=A0A1I8IL79_9PLAT
MPPTEASPCCTRVFVTSLSGCLISVQRRVDDSTSFDRSWAEYAAGFGPGPHSNHWIESCSAKYKGGWWYDACHCTNPNGLYFYSPTALNTAPVFAKSVCWSNPFGYYYSMKEFEMLLL